MRKLSIKLVSILVICILGNSLAAQDVSKYDVLFRNDAVEYNFLPEEKLKENTLIVIIPLYDITDIPNSAGPLVKWYKKKSIKMIDYNRKRLEKIMSNNYPHPYKIMIVDEYLNLDKTKYPYVLVTREEIYTKTTTYKPNSFGISKTEEDLTKLRHYILFNSINYTVYYGDKNLEYRQSSLLGQALTGTIGHLNKSYKW